MNFIESAFNPIMHMWEASKQRRPELIKKYLVRKCLCASLLTGVFALEMNVFYTVDTDMLLSLTNLSQK